jgi:DNA repair protein RadA/Sms
MAKPQTVYVCSDCGGRSAKWQGRCPHCDAWNTLVETVDVPVASGARPGARHGAAAAQFAALAPASGPTLLSAVPAERHSHRSSGIDELDRVLGGGLVPGGVVLLGGDPGIGKSTLLLQVLAALADGVNTPGARATPSLPPEGADPALGRPGGGISVLYVSGEESAAQIALRAQRLNLQAAPVRLMAETRVESILDELAQGTAGQPGYAVAVVDSIQTIYSEALSSAPGSVSQVRECAAQLTRAAKAAGITLVLVGHVTKEGALAGPRVLEHMVDTVLYFEGDTHSSFRLIRAIKNRFGAVNELGVFAMTEHGLRGVSNPSAIFLSAHAEPVAGSCVLATLEGTRPLLVEVQALVDTAAAPSPRRLSVGLDAARLAMLLAVLHRHAGVASADQDVFVNAVGGVRIAEPAADLAVLLAIQSSLRNRPLPRGLVAFGEVGLAGEIRPAPRGQERLREARKLGFSTAIIPAANAPKGAAGRQFEGLDIHPVSRIDEALEAVRGLT